MRKIRQQHGVSDRLFWSDLRGKRMGGRLIDDDGRVMEGEDKVMEAMAKHWEELEKGRDDAIIPNLEIEEMDNCELGMCEEVGS